MTVLPCVISEKNFFFCGHSLSVIVAEFKWNVVWKMMGGKQQLGSFTDYQSSFIFLENEKKGNLRKEG